MATKGGKNGLMMPKVQYNSHRIWICEGEWDGMALWEIFNAEGMAEDIYSLCGAGNFPRVTSDLFAGKEVVLMFDNDEPGQRGMLKVWKLLDGLAAKRLRLGWPEGLPKGFDVRDLYLAEKRQSKKTFKKIKEMISDELPDAISIDGSGTVPVPEQQQTKIVEPSGRGLSATAVIRNYRKWLELPNTEVLDVIFGSVFANRIQADPLWVFIIAPPGGSKSELLMPLHKAPLIYCTTSLTQHALISGANMGGGDPSLIPRIIGKTLVIKDFTTILSMNQNARDEIFGALRDAYDGRTQREFGNNVIRSYEGKFGILAGVTPIIDSGVNANSVLGERFIKYRIKQRGRINVGNAMIMRALDNVTSENNMREELSETARRVLDRRVDKKKVAKVPRWFKLRLVELSQWVGLMRGCVSRERYTQQVTFKPTAEIGTRLAKQLYTLTLGICVYRGMNAVNEDIYNIISRVAVDTAPDRVEEILKQMYVQRYDGQASTEEIASWSRFPKETCRYVLQDMQLLHIVHKQSRKGGGWQINHSFCSKMDRLKLYIKEIKQFGKKKR